MKEMLHYKVPVYHLELLMITNNSTGLCLCAPVEGENPALALVSQSVGPVESGETLLAAQRHAGTPLGSGSAHRQRRR